MKLSVIIPVYNVEKYLDQCIQSVLQLDMNLEILLIDDGSTDQSSAMCDLWAKKDRRIRVVHQENAGLSAARNQGIEISTGEYLMFLDSDDFLDPAESKMLCRTLDADAVVGLYNNYYEAENLFVPESAAAFSGKKGLLSRDDFLRAVPPGGQDSYLVAVRFIVRRTWILENRLFFFPGIYHEDEDWAARALGAAKSIRLTDHRFYNYRQARKDSITGTVKPKHIRDSLLIMDRLSGLRAQQSPGAYADFLGYRLALLYSNILLHLYILPSPDRAETVSRMKNHKRLCLSHLQGTKGGLIKAAVRIFGVGGAARILHTAQKLRGNQG